MDVRLDTKIGSGLGGEETQEGARPVPIFLLFALILASATASDYAAHFWDTTFFGHVNSLMEWALLMRVMPILLVAMGVVFMSIGLLLIPRCARYLCHSKTNLDSRQHLVEDGGEIPRSQVQIQHGKVNLRNLVEQEAQLGPLELKACGPERMLSELISITRWLTSEKYEVILENLEAELWLGQNLSNSTR